MHYYQPGWTLVGGGIKSVDFTTKPMKDVLPKNADWIKSKVVSFDPDNSKLSTDGGDDISYEYLVIAMGMQLRYEDVSNLSQWLKIPKNVSYIMHEFLRNFQTLCLNFINRVLLSSTSTM